MNVVHVRSSVCLTAVALAACSTSLSASVQIAIPDDDGGSAGTEAGADAGDASDGSREATGSDANDEGLVDGALDADAGSPDADGASPPLYHVARGIGLHACAWRNQDLFCWGQNHQGQLGIGTVSDLEFPTRVTGLGAIRQVAVGGAYTCAVEMGGNLYCWGDNSLNQLGDGTTNPHLVPNLVPGVSDVVMVAAGGNHTCAVESSGTVLCWGDGYTGSTADPSLPAPVDGLTDGVEVVADSFLTCVRRAGGTISCWGPNEYGDVGDGQVTVAPTPMTVVGLSALAVQVVAGDSHACARLADGTAFCWGRGTDGELGDGISHSSTTPSPIVVPPGEAIVELASGGATCARLASGRVACWGLNTQGQLGDGTTAQESLVPVLVSNLADAVDVAGTCAVRASGEVLCWGVNDYGEVGDGTRVNRNVPTAVVGLAP
jgi:alpha-tubulin suppressor-like RCC1 family protein